MMLALIAVAISLGLSNLAAAIGVGAAGIDWRTRLRVVAVFGALEAAMPVLGLVAGHSLAARIGAQARWLAAILLAGVGGYAILAAVRARAAAAPGRAASWPRLLVSGVALSLDNLVAGFALGAFHVSPLIGAITFGAVSALMALAGLEFGARIGRRAGDGGEVIGGAALIAIAVAIGAGWIS